MLPDADPTPTPPAPAPAPVPAPGPAPVPSPPAPQPTPPAPAPALGAPVPAPTGDDRLAKLQDQLIAVSARAVFAEHKGEIPDLEDADLRADILAKFKASGADDFGDWFTAQRAAGKGLFRFMVAKPAADPKAPKAAPTPKPTTPTGNPGAAPAPIPGAAYTPEQIRSMTPAEFKAHEAAILAQFKSNRSKGR